MNEDYLHLTGEALFKIDFIKSTIKEEVDREDVLRGLLDEGFGIAVCKQQREGKLTPDALTYALGMMDEELKDVVVKEIAKSSPSN